MREWAWIVYPPIEVVLVLVVIETNRITNYNYNDVRKKVNLLANLDMIIAFLADSYSEIILIEHSMDGHLF